jgi:competence protein ComEC
MKIWKYLVSMLSLVCLAVWLAVFSVDQNLHIVACDVGQGDAILFNKGNSQILVDGGPNNDVLSCLGDNIPFWDKEIELVILTHPEYDHFEGLIEVFKNYRVDNFISSSLESSSQDYQVLQNAVKASRARIINPKDSQKIRIGLIYLDILWPSKEYQLTNGVNYEENVLGISTSSKDANSFSVVAILSLGKFSALITGDIPPDIADIIAQDKTIEGVDYIKVPHHGSKNGLTKNLLLPTSPAIAVISVGKDNSYGHPHEEILSMLKDQSVEIKRTDLDGEVEIVTDGQTWWSN